jgi:transposase
MPPQWEHSLCDVFNSLRYIVRTGIQSRMMPNDLPPWHTAYQQVQRWLRASVFEDMVRDLRMLMREIEDRPPQPRAAIWDRRTLQYSPESGKRIRPCLRGRTRPTRHLDRGPSQAHANDLNSLATNAVGAPSFLTKKSSKLFITDRTRLSCTMNRL